MSRTCRGCGYHPIGPFSDNCPMCAEPVRGGGGGGLGALEDLPPVLVCGWLVLGLVLAYLFWGDWLWLLPNLALCGGAWYGAVRGERLLVRVVCGGLLVPYVPAVAVALSPGVLPGLGNRDPSPADGRAVLRALLRGETPEVLRTRARLQTASVAVWAVDAAVVLPLALLVPPLLSRRTRRKLGGPIPLSRRQAVGGLAAWVVVLPLLGWLAWPTVRGWADPANSPIQPHWPGEFVPTDDEDDPE